MMALIAVTVALLHNRIWDARVIERVNPMTTSLYFCHFEIARCRRCETSDRIRIESAPKLATTCTDRDVEPHSRPCVCYLVFHLAAKAVSVPGAPVGSRCLRPNGEIIPNENRSVRPHDTMSSGYRA